MPSVHGEGGDDGVLRRGGRKKAAVDAPPVKIKLTLSRGEGVVGRRHDQCRGGRGKAVEGAPFEGGAPVQCKEDLDWRGVASRTSPCSIII